ncbi:hypothetical protein [Marinagarivorans cellulosilyticus]|uniref:Uncharacterized protein n=1 Tax=Marinagarivorans cellulosilyticus TaxID=2721545 RepID=A0AAN2BKY6_9GAMM|nr:hypothetical protein [Marinagarivorans cellulosilyticus]BCD98568.1 hypothetical protein MARGE09_P2769 [Marinagarivorans cellulosilyticus]
MRLSTLFLLFSISLATGCGSDNDESTTSSSSPTYPPITQEPANDVVLKAGEFYRPTAFVDDAANDRWLIADRMQGIIAVNKTSDARSILTPLSSDETGLQNITDMALDPATNTLYILDTTAKNIAVIDSDGDITATLDSDIFDDLVDAGWGAPTSLFFDTSNQRLLIGDRAGLEIENSNGDTTYAFCVFIYTPANANLSIMSEVDSRESPRYSIYDIYYDPENERLLASGLIYLSNSSVFYAAQIIPENDWGSASYFYIKTDESISSTAVLHNVTYDPENTAAYIVDSDDNTVYGFNLSLLSDTTIALERTAITDGNDGKAYPFQRSTSISFNAELGLLLMDETNRALVSIDHVELPQTPPGEPEGDEATEETESEDFSAARNLLIAGVPLSSTPETFLQFPYDILIEPISAALVITDRADAQRNAIESNANGYTPWSFTFNVDSITPYNVNYDSSEDAQVPAPPSVTEPKPILLAKNQRDDMFMYALSFNTQSDDEYVHHRYPAGIYQRLGSEGGDADFVPISTFDITTDDETKTYMQDFSGLFAPSELRDFAVTQDGIIFHYERSTNTGTRSFVAFWQRSQNALITISSSSTTYNPRNVTGMTLSPNEDTLYFTDAYHDALISVALSNLDDTPNFEFTVVSGRQHDGDYMALPAGLALNQATTKAWVFDNATRAIIEIDLETGNRTRLDSSVNYIQSIKSVELSEDETTLYLIEKTLNRVISIDLIEDYPQSWLTPTGESSAE